MESFTKHKYYVFSEDDFNRMQDDVWKIYNMAIKNEWTSKEAHQLLRSLQERAENGRIKDAVVIRAGDVFAGPAFHLYAASIGLAATFMERAQRHQLMELADYFHTMALEADATKPE